MFSQIKNLFSLTVTIGILVYTVVCAISLIKLLFEAITHWRNRNKDHASPHN